MTTPRTTLAAAVLGAGLALAAPAPAPAAAAAGGAPRVEVVLEPATATVGDRVTATVTLVLPDGRAENPRFPVWGDSWGGAEILSAGTVERLPAPAGAGTLHRQRLVLAAFRTGTIELPPRVVVLPGEDGAGRRVSTPAGLALTVSSVLPGEGEGPPPEPAPPAPPRRLPAPLAFWWTLAAMTALALGAIALAVRRARPAEAAGAPAAALEPPGPELVAALAEIEREPSAARAHLLLSRALRRYLGRTFGFPAPQSSTPEVRRELSARHAPAVSASRAAEVLAACDRVKFAGETAGADAVAARTAAAREIAAAVEAHFAGPPTRATASRGAPS